MEDGVVVLLDIWGSTYGMRIRIALAERGIKYECIEEENILVKSPLLLKMNPVYKRVPVLIHNGKPICESLLILEYMDQVWKHKSPALLPSDAYQRGLARFWAAYVDAKIYEGSAKKVWMSGGEEQEKASKDFIDCLKVIEKELGEKLYFSGEEEMGFVDVALIPLYCYFFPLEMFGKFSVETECPKLMNWAKQCMKKESVSQSLARPQRIYEAMLDFRKTLQLA
ncbi:hypothetical protein MKW98_004893 [Papaver atlanticum]|uniref:Glutathione S-transferase n=1 Tax=Papaver atlanticum TaxID=357466 RepID=A0AAD4T636_9MAGN|nr:hypothetical protein MKW98_004893 [Papaver atlanticum]